MVEAAPAFVAWLGVSLIVLADGRRGLATGTAVATAGIAALVLQGAGLVDAALLAAGGAVAAARGLRAAGGWGLTPPGSTPRLILCVAGGLLALWIAASITAGPGAALRFTVLSVTGLMAARTLSSDDPPVLVASVGVLALGLAVAAGLAGTSQGPWPYLVAAVIAAGSAWLPLRAPRAA